MFDSRHGKGMKRSEASQCKDGDGVDFISNMPDAILVSIFSRLESTEEAIRSSILSRRWRYLWTEIPSISIFCYQGRKHRRNFNKNKLKEFVNWVLLKQSVDLDKFDISCSSYYSMSTVGPWIQAAVTRNVKQLDLSFCPKVKKEIETEDVEMPLCLVTCPSLQVLKLNFDTGHSLRLPIIKGFPALRVLHLIYAELLDKDLIESFFGSFPLLEDLSLIECVIFKLDRLCLSCPNLKRLKIENEMSLNLGGIKIFCPKLVDLHLGGHFADSIFFESLDSLKEAVILPDSLGSIIPVVLFPGFSHVESLSIDFHFFTQCIDATRDPGLPNLKTLVLTTSMDVFTMDNFNRVLKHYLKLESLKLIIEQYIDDASDPALPNLKTLHLMSKYPAYTVEPLIQVLKYCPKLESLSLTVRMACSYNLKEYDELESRKLDEAETRSILTPDVKSIEFFEFNGEKPKLDISWYGKEKKSEWMYVAVRWGNKSRYSH